jgi:glucose-1-phosphate thymidylyltransferase
MKRKIFPGSNEKITCVVLCAGEGTRLLKDLKEGGRVAKAMVEIAGKPLISYVTDYWKQFAHEFIFVVNFQKEKIIEYIKTLPIKSSFVEQKELRGIAYALSLTEDMVTDNFVMALGDCIINGEFEFPENMKMGVGVWRTQREEDIQRSYSIEIEKDNITRVVEKPKVLVNDFCGMGYYFFNKKVFDYIRKTPPSALRGEIEITDALQQIINGGDKLSPVFFKGDYLNVTYAEDLPKAEAIAAKYDN